MTPEKAARLAANSLIQAFKDTIHDDGSISVPLEPFGMRPGPSGRPYLLRQNVLTKIGKAARKLVPLLDSYPIEKCIDHLTDMVVKVKDSGTPLTEAHNKIRDGVLQFLQTFSTQGHWEVVYSIKGLTRSDCPFAVSVCQFYVMDENQFVLWGRRMASGRYDPPNSTPILQNWLQHERALQGQVVAAVRIQATDHEHARAKGKSRIVEVLNVLRYAQLAAGVYEVRFPEIGLSSQDAWDDHSIVIQLDRPNFGTNKSSSGQSGIPLSIIRTAPGWNGLEQLVRLDLSARNELQLRLTTALEWIGQAALAPSTPIRLVALVTALEALLIEESESLGKKSKLANRVSKLVGQSSEEEQSLAKEVEEVYEARSECVHAGLMNVEKDELDRTARLIAKTLDAIFTKPPYCTANRLADIVAHIDPPAARSEDSRSRWVAENAYFRWLNEGCSHDRQLQHWLDAEREFICNTLLRGRPLKSFGAERRAENEEEETD